MSEIKEIIKKKSAIYVEGDATESSSSNIKIKVSKVIDLETFSIKNIKQFIIEINENN